VYAGAGNEGDGVLLLVFSGNFTYTKSIFQANLQKISIVSGNFTKNLKIFHANFHKILIFQAVLQKNRFSTKKLAI